MFRIRRKKCSASCPVEETLLEEIIDRDWKIVRQTCARKKPHAEIHYVLLDGETKRAEVKGWAKKSDSFYIDRIENFDKVRGKGFQYVSTIYSVLVPDLQERGVLELTTYALRRIAPRAMRDYGFEHKRGLTPEQITNSLRPFVAIKLRKDI